MSWLLQSPAPLVLVTALYLLQALAYWRTAQRGMAVVFLGYAAANVGLILAWYGR